jgi:hypothetical protein
MPKEQAEKLLEQRPGLNQSNIGVRMATLSLPACEPIVHIPDLTGLAISGVYFLIHEGQVVYVGQSVDMRRRLADHIGEGAKVFDSITFIPLPISQLNVVEARHIKRYLPRYNNCPASQAIRHGRARVVELSKREAMAALDVDEAEFDSLNLPSRRLPRRKAVVYAVRVVC